MQVVFRVDASLTMGSGHVMRCLTLADALHEQGIMILFICRELPGHMCDFIAGKGYKVYRLPYKIQLGNDAIDERTLWAGERWQTDAEQADQVLQEINVTTKIHWLIVDHYSLDILWEQRVRKHTEKIMVLDDLANRYHDCDLLLDQNLYRDMQTRYNGLLTAYCQTLLGPQYALLRQEFYEARKTVKVRDGIVRRIIVFFGGSDPTNETSKALQAIGLLHRNDLYVDVIVGKINPHRTQIQKLCNHIPNTTFYCQINNMAELMAKADLAIGAGGSTTWERLCLGLPSLVVRIADNQERLTEDAQQLGLLIDLGVADTINIDTIAIQLEKIMSEPQRLKLISQRGIDFVDGKGIDKVVKYLMDMKYKIMIVSDQNSWINTYISAMTQDLSNANHLVKWVHDVREVESSDMVFYLSCSQIIPKEILGKSHHNLVVHESALPQGRGWSPLTWQILEGKTQIPISLFEAAEAVDSGKIYLQTTMKFKGTELLSELHECQAKYTIQMCMEFISRYPGIIKDAVRQEGMATYYPRRISKDSQLDIDKTIREQFNLLRVVDNEKYPAFIKIHGCEYFIKVYRKTE
ncbi:UDP-2,4-diacetamido-2,4,6-trideoxy-beta-L-altropyranose hydrolase [Pelosinus sp. sgz500959]|uniref:UDP-2,4-diacetamido-2,4, 6-trideoxy-beta-L-altropyranose hydrolase n=1 Tax=Pelosinus sp. sgz500959 TaxID=3242472 RepID=UPI003672BB17